MEFIVGTSGYGYKEWRGKFYPAKMPTDEMLPYYAEQFASTELNNTFYKLPTIADVRSWTKQVPASFRFAIKAPQTITHRKRLRAAETETKSFLKAAAAFGRRRGPLLFQLPPNFKKDLPRLAAFLKLLGKRSMAAFEFRHPSWSDDEIYELLRTYRCALVAADADELPAQPLLDLNDWGYVRLRRKDYSDKQLRTWIERLRERKWKQAYVYFKHEETASGPRLARRFLELAEK